MIDENFLKYPSSMVAACSVILSINIFEKDMESYENMGFFNGCYTNKQGLVEFNTDIWNNE